MLNIYRQMLNIVLKIYVSTNVHIGHIVIMDTNRSSLSSMYVWMNMAPIELRLATTSDGNINFIAYL